jgi:hypothetical protein
VQTQQVAWRLHGRSLVALDCESEDALNVVAGEGRVGHQDAILRQLACRLDSVEVFVPVYGVVAGAAGAAAASQVVSGTACGKYAACNV